MCCATPNNTDLQAQLLSGAEAGEWLMQDHHGRERVLKASLSNFVGLTHLTKLKEEMGYSSAGTGHKSSILSSSPPPPPQKKGQTKRHLSETLCEGDLFYALKPSLGDVCGVLLVRVTCFLIWSAFLGWRHSLRMTSVTCFMARCNGAMARGSTWTCPGPHHQNLKHPQLQGAGSGRMRPAGSAGLHRPGCSRTTQNIFISSCKSLLRPVQCCAHFQKDPTEMDGKRGDQSWYPVSSLMMLCGSKFPKIAAGLESTYGLARFDS